MREHGEVAAKPSEGALCFYSKKISKKPSRHFADAKRHPPAQQEGEESQKFYAALAGGLHDRDQIGIGAHICHQQGQIEQGRIMLFVRTCACRFLGK